MPSLQDNRAKISISEKRASITSIGGGQSEGRDLPLLFDSGIYFDDGHYFDKGREGLSVSNEKSKVSSEFRRSTITKDSDRAKISFRRERI